MHSKYVVAMSALAAAAIAGLAGVAGAQNPTHKSTSLSSVCVGITNPEPETQRRRLDDLRGERSSLRNQLAAAQEVGDSGETKQFAIRIATLTSRIDRVQMSQRHTANPCGTRT